MVLAFLHGRRKGDKKMKKVMTLILAVFGLLALTSLAYAAAAGSGIASTKHNLSSGDPFTAGVAGTANEICVYCHTPHGGKKAIADDGGPLWNRAYSVAAFTPYESYTLDSDTSGAPKSVSKACLSCHDGSIGINAMINRPGPGANQGGATEGWKMGDAGGSNDMAKLGNDLRDDHPISMIYSAAKSYGTGAAVGTDSFAAGFTAATTSGTKPVVVKGSVTLPLYGTGTGDGRVECGTCHDPHEERSKTEATSPADSVFFLRVAGNQGSQLCLTCHKK